MTCEFSTATDSGHGQQLIPPPQPFDDPPIQEWDAHEEKEPAYFAFDRKNDASDFAFDSNDKKIPIANSAGDLYDPPPERIVTIQVLRVTKNQADFDYLLAARYSNSINSNSRFFCSSARSF